MKNNTLFLVLIALSPSLYTYASSSDPICDDHTWNAFCIPEKNHKKWTFAVYIAANNNLDYFSDHNLNQMKQIGSNEHLNIVAQYSGAAKGFKTKRLFIEKENIKKIEESSCKIDSGSVENFLEFMQWTVKHYPSDHICIVLWGHGSGSIDFSKSNRIIQFLSGIKRLTKKRGVCIDDTSGNYINTIELENALEHIAQTVLGGKKIDIIAFDACLMSMIEVASVAKDYAHLMVSSQASEPGAGWDYNRVLKIFTKSTAPTKEEFVHHIAHAYKKTYQHHFFFHKDYTISTLNLDIMHELEANVHYVAQLLIECLQTQKGTIISDAIKQAHSKQNCTFFTTAEIIDLHHFYTNLSGLIDTFEFENALEKTASLQKSLKSLLQHGNKLIEETVVINNKAGKAYKKARGISIYFPTTHFYKSYLGTSFGMTNAWAQFLQEVGAQAH